MSSSLVAGPVATARVDADRSSSFLRNAGVASFSVAVLGQLILASCVAILHGRERLSGDLASKLTIGLHLLLTLVNVVTGALQALPVIRRRASTVHRWSGRVYMTSALAVSLSGILMVWTRGPAPACVDGGVAEHIGLTITGGLMIASALLAWHYARIREFAAHRRWALRLFLLASGVWLLRVGPILWQMLHGPLDPSQAPLIAFFAFAEFLLPLVIFELYLRVESRGSATGRFAMAATLWVITLGMVCGLVSLTPLSR
jgi:uncharacterized membrane protein